MMRVGVAAALSLHKMPRAHLDRMLEQRTHLADYARAASEGTDGEGAAPSAVLVWPPTERHAHVFPPRDCDLAGRLRALDTDAG